ncbi:MAG: hypothetical protein HQ521_21605 [Bacteroidetes bacterium]|nr:hypothetical protein [Bacteroidota bacterium]
MKKVALLLGIVAVIGFSSCKKEKNCKCTTDTMGQTAETIVTTKESCSSLNTETTYSGITIKMTCVEE